MSTDKLQSTSWADDVDETIAAPEPQIKTITTPDSDVITTIEVRTLPDGKRVQVTRKFKKVLKKSNVNQAVADRKTWPKFGLEKGKPAGPDRATTTVGENVVLKLSAGNDSAVEEPSEEQLMKERLKSKKIVCRLCKGDHFTTKCPYKSTLGDLDSAQDSTQTPDESNANQGTAAAATSTGKYIPPSQRAGARASGAGPGGPSRDEYPTLRVTNVSEDTHEDDLRELFRRFGRVQRVFIGRDRETRASKGFAFVSFELRSDAEKALEKVNGMGYDNLILSVQWSQPRDK
ncbi:translation initiation factor 3, RNA-binding subunit [Wallemia mellicola CBS 633.66]|uniref:Eukaryotic translation initiation factor 3 subunit G n=1 Tax=Wallemia mellicola (strain ATCC MYA-4683 / CBS 633.66) TaxID=671144 RepID=I4Y6T4_WALMC|nr:translation initiation factor 3, RNA-binding subunit [Wallemia mellicola CBS 633.66]EIM19676.1 translation initiation factor 3, RNA-binding subunit [Wallemia mellicola CBS 633.66]|eukprot:XP_006960337.1 translation initiation factor 3, RNA-binding subunit [Wallemia mellicola CBS 633.66]